VVEGHRQLFAGTHLGQPVEVHIALTCERLDLREWVGGIVGTERHERTRLRRAVVGLELVFDAALGDASALVVARAVAGAGKLAARIAQRATGGAVEIPWLARLATLDDTVSTDAASVGAGRVACSGIGHVGSELEIDVLEGRDVATERLAGFEVILAARGRRRDQHRQDAERRGPRESASDRPGPRKTCPRAAGHGCPRCGRCGERDVGRLVRSTHGRQRARPESVSSTGPKCHALRIDRCCDGDKCGAGFSGVREAR